MQVQHEAHLIEANTSRQPQESQPSTTNGQNSSNVNKSLDYYTLSSQTSSPLSAIEHISSCPVNNLVVVHLANSNQLVLYDTRSHLKRDRFPLKACDKRFSRQSFQLSGLDFSQDGQRLAVGQTDCIIYIYKFTYANTGIQTQSQQQQVIGGQPMVSGGGGGGGGGALQAVESSMMPSFKPTISGKFASTSPITCLIWCDLGIVFGCQDGRVKLITMSASNSQVSQQLKSSSGQLTASDHSGPGNSSSSPGSTSGSQPSKVINIFAPQRTGSMPISLAYKSPFLLIGLTDNTVQILTISMDHQPTLPLGATNEGADLSLQSIQQQQQNSSRRNSSQPSPSASWLTSIEHSCPSGQLKLLPDNVVCFAGSDGRLAFHSIKSAASYNSSSSSPKTPSKSKSSRRPSGSEVQNSLLHSIDLNEDIMALDYSNINEVLAVATRSRLLFVKLDQEANQWRLQGSSIELTSTGGFKKKMQTSSSNKLQSKRPNNLSTLSLASLVWTRDGSQLLVGCSNGSLELFKCIYNKQSISEQLDICHIAKNRVRITDRERNLLATYKTQSDIKRVNLLDNGQSVIIWTVNSLLLARLNNSHLQSEIQWSQQQRDNKNVRFLFSADSFVLLFTETNRELRIIKLGSSTNPKYTRKFNQSINRKLISVRQFPSLVPSLTSASNGSLSPQQKLSPNRTSIGSRSVSSAASQRSGSQPRNSSSGNLTLTSDLSDLLSAQQQQQQQQQQQHPASATATSDQLITNNATQSHESLYERFAFVDPENPKQLEIVDLKGDQDHTNGTRNETISIESQNDIISLEFSFTSKYLIFRDSTQRLHLIEFQVSPKARDDNDGGPKQTSIKESRVLLESCEFAGWIHGTDSLVAQSHHTIRLWFDLEELKRVDLFDSRSFNINRRPPLIDISLLPLSSSQTTNEQSTKAFPNIRELTGDDESHHEIKLTNGQSIPLDLFRIRFYGHLIGGRLNVAVNLLERQEASMSADVDKQLICNLYTKLAWMLIEDERQRDCELALRVFTRLNYKSLCKYLAECIERAELGDEAEKELRLATLCGHWHLFETLAESERIVATYKRLNKWLRCIDYLERNQKFRQRDIAEQEHRQWLISRSRHLEAAKIQANTQGDLTGALELLMAHELFVEAGQLFVSQQKAPLLSSGLTSSGVSENKQLAELADRLQRSLVDSKQYLIAGQLSERVQGELVGALELYLKAEAYEEALGLIGRSCSSKPEAADDKVLVERISARESEIKFLFGTYLEGQWREQKLGGRKAKRAIELYLESGHPFEAFKLALDLRLYDRAFEILIGQPKLSEQSEKTDQLREQCSRLGSVFRQQVGGQNNALKAYELASDYEQMIELLIELDDFERAFQVSLERVHSNNRQRTSEQFIKLAQRFASTHSNDHNLNKAEQIYLLLEKPDLAIEMYKEAQDYDKMLELIGKHRPDQLEGSLLHLARQLEAESRFKEAEKYLLRASPNEWTNVVRMYRLASEWPDAYRVARANCTTDQDPLLVQLAYWWAKSLLVAKSGDITIEADDKNNNDDDDNNNNSSPTMMMMNKARQLLVDLNVLSSVIEFCCETQNYTFAIELSKTNDQLRERVVLRYAKYLEQEHKFNRAEQVLLENNLIDWAVKMYLDNEKQTEAINLIERQLQQHSDEPTVIEELQPNGLSKPRRRSQLVELLNGTLIECANKLANSNEDMDHPSKSPASGKPTNQLNKNQLTTSKGQLERLQMAQQMYLRAQRPELAIEMYRGRGMWQEAIQVAQRFAPRLLESIERALDEQVNDDIEPILRSFPSRAGEEEKPTVGGVHQQGTQEVTDQRINGQKGLINGQAMAATLAQVSAPEASQFDSLRVQIDSLIRSDEKNKDKKNEARVGLSRFIFNLWAQVNNNPSLIGDSMGQLSQLVGLARADSLQLADLKSTGLANQDNLGKISSLADMVFLNIDWWLAPNGRVWQNLRHTLESCWCSSNLYLDDDQQQQQQQQETSGPTDRRRIMALGFWQSRVDPMGSPASSCDALERRLLVAHYVALHCSLANELQARFLSIAQHPNGSSSSSSPSSVFRSRPQFGGGSAAVAAINRQQAGQVNVGAHLTDPLSIGQLEELSSRLSQERPRKQLHQKDPAALLRMLVDLLSKLSLSMLRYMDLVDCLRALYFAGLWQVAAGRHQLARTIWSLLIELADNNNNNNNNNEANLLDGNKQTWTATRSSPNRAALVRQVDLPDQLRASKIVVQRKQQTTMDNGAGQTDDLVGGLTSDQLTDVRQWLLETLIERSDQLAASDSSTRQLDARMSNQRPTTSTGLVQATCLLTGLPVLVKPNPIGNDRMKRDDDDDDDDDDDQDSQYVILGSRFNRLLVVRRAEWLNLSDCLDLIGQDSQKTNRALRIGKPGGLLNSHHRRATTNSTSGHSGPGGVSGDHSQDLNNVVEFLIRLSGTTTTTTTTTTGGKEEQRYK